MEVLKGCEALVDGVTAFVAEYAHRNYRRALPHDGKTVHDALWGTIRLEPWEVAILDLPLFQRLRQVSQTSLVHYVFPGCRHSRFEHTLGVIHQTQKLTEAVNQHATPGNEPFDHNTVHELRLAALFHDCGHACFSHISENIYKELPDVRSAVARDAYFQGCHAHELISALILRTEGMREYLDELGAHYKFQINVDRIADWIVGKDVPGFDYLTQVINGTFDADKLDYIFRDAHFSGLPVGLDLERLWASCNTGRVTIDGHSRTILTLHQACVSPLEQILLAKMTLFAVVYQHPKVRAAECMFRSAMDMIRARSGEAGIPRLACASDFLWLTDGQFFGLADRLAKDDPLHGLLHDILYRRHLVRALTISQDTIENLATDPKQKIGYHELRQLNHVNEADHGERRTIAEAIWERAGKPCPLHMIHLDMPPDAGTGGADHTFVNTGGGNYRKLTELFPINYWLEMFSVHKWRGHVFCPQFCQAKVSGAAVAVLADLFGLKFNRLAMELSHVAA